MVNLKTALMDVIFNKRSNEIINMTQIPCLTGGGVDRGEIKKRRAPGLSEPCAPGEDGFGCPGRDSAFPSGGAAIPLPAQFQLSFG